MPHHFYDQPFNTKEFEQPSAAYRGKPLWCWNDKLEPAELLRQLRIFKEMGLGGFFMHSRTGLATEYLGEQWFEFINMCSDEAKKLGLEAWLYDEDRWPSGSAGGKVTEDPAMRMKYLRLTIHASPQGLDLEADEMIAVYRGQINGVNCTSSSRVLDLNDLQMGDDSLMVFTREVMKPHPFFNGNAYLDTLSREATDKFIELTHQAYQANCGERLGDEIEGIFTDEPHHGMVLCENVQHNYQADSGWVLPWTENLPGSYQVSFGEDLLERLPELFLRQDGARISPVKWRYMETLQKMFLENWAAPLRKASNGMNLKLTGHVLHEDTLSAQVIPCGSLMRYYEHLDYPGIDVLGSENENYWLAKPVQSASRQQGKPWIMSELYGCTGWEMGFDGHKRIGDWQAMFGVNIRSHHLCWYSMAGESKRDYPGSLFFQSPWHQDYAIVEDYFSRLGYLLQQGQAWCEVLVLNPVESVAAQIYPGWATWMGSNSPDVDRLERQYESLFRLFTNAQIDFDYGDEDQLSRWAEVIEVDGEVRLKLGCVTYRHVVISGAETIRSSTLRIFSEFKQRGGAVYFLGEAPSFVDALPSPQAVALAARCECFADAGSGFLKRLEAQLAAPVSVTLLSNVEITQIPLLSQIRRVGEDWVVVLMNTRRSGNPLEVAITFEKSTACIEELDCRSGQRYSTAAESIDGKTVLRVCLEALCEVALISAAEKTLNLVANPRHQRVAPSGVVEVSGGFAYDLDEPNICVLDKAHFKLGQGEWQDPLEIVRLDEAVRSELGLSQRDGEMLQPWVSDLKQVEESTTPLLLEFEFDVEVVPASGSVDLLLEQPEFFTVEINGAPVDLGQASTWFIDPCFRRFSIPADSLRAGANVIRLKTDFCHRVNLEAIYLLGNFGVALAHGRVALTDLPSKLNLGSITEQGLPFYSGKIAYQMHLPEAVGSGSMRVDMDGCVLGAFAKLYDSSEGGHAVFALPPYRDSLTLTGAVTDFVLEVCLTRRNTFGPFHEVENADNFVAPFSFRTKGAAFTNDYKLVEAGLMQSPRFDFSKSDEGKYHKIGNI